MKRKRYRYLYDVNSCSPDDELSCQYLYGGPGISHDFDAVVRIELPENMKLIRFPEGYSMTHSDIKIKDLNPQVMVRINSRLGFDKQLQEMWLTGKLMDVEQYMGDKGYERTAKWGYVTCEQYKFHISRYRESLLLDKLPDIKTDEEIKAYIFEYPMTEANKARIAKLREYFANDEYLHGIIKPELLDDCVKEFASWSDEKILLGIYNYAENHCTIKTPRTIDYHFADETRKNYMSHYWLGEVALSLIMKTPHDNPLRKEFEELRHLF